MPEIWSLLLPLGAFGYVLEEEKQWPCLVGPIVPPWAPHPDGHTQSPVLHTVIEKEGALFAAAPSCL